MQALLEKAQIALNKKDWETVNASIQRLLNQKDAVESIINDEILDLALEALQKCDFQQRWEIAKLFPQIGKPAIAPLIALLESEEQDGEMRWFLARILSQFDDRACILALSQLLQRSEEEELSQMAAAALANIGSSAISSLGQLLSDSNTRFLAVQALLEDKVERIILTRPAVEAGEKLGFLPGDLQQKVDPFLRPLYDALYEFIEAAKIPDLMERGKIEIAPLAYMRGRTLANAFVIVDEAQNTTPAQLKMVLTRLGFGSRMVVTGDVTQTDLPQPQESGLIAAQKILKSVEGIAFCYLSRADVVRHPLVQKIVSAYEQHEK